MLGYPLKGHAMPCRIGGGFPPMANPAAIGNAVPQLQHHMGSPPVLRTASTAVQPPLPPPPFAHWHFPMQAVPFAGACPVWGQELPIVGTAAPCIGPCVGPCCPTQFMNPYQQPPCGLPCVA